MEYQYWLTRKRASLVLAELATSSEARLIHLGLARHCNGMAVAVGA